MNKRIKHIWTSLLMRLTVAMILCALACPADAYARHNTPSADARENMIRSLAKTSSATDSITLLYNIYDLSTESQADSIGRIIYRMARRKGYDDVALDILRDLAQIHFEDLNFLKKIETILQTDFRPSDLQKETLVFVRIYRAYVEAGNTPEKELKEKIARIINYYGAEFSNDPYERLMQQFLQCIFIGHETQGELLNQYIDVLERLLQNMPRQSDRLKARFYRQKAYSYTINSDPKRAVEADKKLLDLYDHTEEINHRQGRPFRSLDHFRHNSITRMLSNYSALTLEEVDSLYDEIVAIEKAKPSFADNKHAVPKHKVFQLMAHGNYAAAVEPLKALVADEKDHIERRMLLKELITAAEQTGRKDDLLAASNAYAQSMEEYLNSKLSEIIRELQIIFNVDQLQTDSANIELKIQQEIGYRHSVRLKVLLVLAAAVIVLLLIFLILYRKFRSLTDELTDTNEKLKEKHEELRRKTEELQETIEDAIVAETQKDAFIKYISSTISLPLRSMMEYSNKIIESSKSDAKPFLTRFGKVIRENYEALTRISARLEDLSTDQEEEK